MFPWKDIFHISLFNLAKSWSFTKLWPLQPGERSSVHPPLRAKRNFSGAPFWPQAIHGPEHMAPHCCTNGATWCSVPAILLNHQVNSERKQTLQHHIPWRKKSIGKHELEGTRPSTTKLNYISLWPAARGGASLIAGVGMLAQWKAQFMFFHWAFQIRIFKIIVPNSVQQICSRTLGSLVWFIFLHTLSLAIPQK